MEGDIPPAHFSEQERRPRLDVPEIVIQALESSSNLANQKIARDITKVIEFARGELSYDSPEARGIRMLEETEAHYVENKRIVDEVPDEEILQLLGNARAKLGRGGLVAAENFIQDINQILREHPGLFYVVYTDGTEAPLVQVQHDINKQTGELEFYDNPYGAEDERQARAYMVDVSRLPAAARRVIDGHF